jgi:uncharacterized protein
MTDELSCAAHNIDHVMRVYQLCQLIAETESNVNMAILEPAALLHDIARVLESKDQTGQTDHALVGSQMAVAILKEIDYPEAYIEPIAHCIASHRYRSDNVPKTIEAKILFDADKLDVIGSIGIARTFMLAGQYGQRLTADFSHDNVVDNGRLKDVSKHSPLMEYDYKFKKIPDRLFTPMGKAIGIRRLAYMRSFFERLASEMAGEI